MEKRKKIRRYIFTGILWLVSILHIYPIFLVIISSIKSKHDLALNPFGLPKEITFEYFSQAFKTMHYVRSVLNTTLIAVISVGVILVISSMAAYAIIRKKNRFYNGLYIFFLAGLIVPFQMTMIPLYKLLLSFKLMSTYQGVISIYIAVLAPFSVFLLAGFDRTVPHELEEAALLDGCGIYKTFFKIVFPLLKPALSTVAVLNLFAVWNDFLMPMMYLQDSMKMTITVQLNAFRVRYFNDWSLIFSGVCMIVAPMLVVYLFAQRFIISGITAGGLKG
jgi:raffinose/stachyose/melibiose transport system permease protein